MSKWSIELHSSADNHSTCRLCTPHVYVHHLPPVKATYSLCTPLAVYVRHLAPVYAICHQCTPLAPSVLHLPSVHPTCRPCTPLAVCTRHLQSAHVTCRLCTSLAVCAPHLPWSVHQRFDAPGPEGEPGKDEVLCNANFIHEILARSATKRRIIQDRLDLFRYNFSRSFWDELNIHL